MADAKKPLCKYGEKCYQKNQLHLSKYRHPTSEPTPTKEDHVIAPAAITVNTIQTNSEERTTRRRARSPTNSPSENSDRKKISRSRSPSAPRKENYNLRSPRSGNKNGSSEEINLSPPLPDNAVSQNRRNKSPRISGADTPSSSASTYASLSSGPSPEKDIDFINDCFDKETRFSQRAEYKEMLKDNAVFIRNKFLVEMPIDFYKFWDFCKEQIKKEQPPESLLSKFGLTLLGPFDVLSGKFNDANMFEPGDYLRHCRYYYDPPEFQTILKKEKSGLHYGYWRDVPSGSSNCFIAKNDVNKGCEITIIADNIFSAVIHFLDKDAGLTPFNRGAANSLKKSLEIYAAANGIRLDTFSTKVRARNLTVVTKTFHKAGLVVPVDRKTQVGYRELIETEANIKKWLSPLDDTDVNEKVIDAVMDKLQPLITAANIAVDECDFGNSIELGIDLFCYGAKRLHTVLLQLLVNGYTMVGRPQFIAIIKAHLEQRNRGTNLSIL